MNKEEGMKGKILFISFLRKYHLCLLFLHQNNRLRQQFESHSKKVFTFTTN